MARKWKLKPGMAVCNVDVERGGRLITVRVEAGHIYEGEEFAKWYPSVLVAVPEAVVPSLPVPATENKPLRESMRPAITPGEARGASVDPQATMQKKHSEAAAPAPPTPAEEPPESKPESKPKVQDKKIGTRRRNK